MVCAKEIHEDLMRQRRCIAVSYGRPHDSDNTHMTVFYSFLPTTVHTGAPAHDGLGRAALVRRFKSLKPSHKDYDCGASVIFLAHGVVVKCGGLLRQKYD